MNKTLLFCCLLCSARLPLEAQTLFTYGGHKVERGEFLWAYRKNNVHPEGKDLPAYLGLYVNYKLKVQAARDAHLDSTAEFKRDLKGFRQQLAEQTMRRLEGIGRLSREALLRGQTDIEIAQVFVGFARPGDTVEAFQQITQALAALGSGTPFETVAETHGTNPLLRAHAGYTGFITAFSLPYDAENIVYNLRDGAYSGIYRSHSGYHIFKRLSARPNPGEFRAAQILLAIPPMGTPAQKEEVLQRANHVYDSLQHGGNFDSLVRRYSDDKMTYYNYGVLPEFTSGDFDQTFERAAFALSRDGEISRPVETTYGYHIIKRIGLQPTLSDSLDGQRWYAFQQKVFYNDRMEEARDAFADAILTQLRFRSLRPDTAWLIRASDTLLRSRGGEEYIKKVPRTPLFSFQDTTYTSTDWFRYLLYRRTGDTRNPPADYKAALRAFLRYVALDYFQAHLEGYDEDYRYQVQQFAEGTLLFSITQQEVWNRASEDSAGLRHWFDAHRERFYLRRSTDMVSFEARDSATLSAFRERLVQAPSAWRTVQAGFTGVSADSAHIALDLLPVDTADAGEGSITPPLLQPDNHWHAYYLIRLYPPRAATSFDEVKGLVLADYQSYLEKKWLSTLRKKYPVVIHQQALATIQR